MTLERLIRFLRLDVAEFGIGPVCGFEFGVKVRPVFNHWQGRDDGHAATRSPALGYAVPNDLLVRLQAVGLANSRAAQSLRREIGRRAGAAGQIALANAGQDVPEKIAAELRAIIARLINPELAGNFVAGLQGKPALANAFNPGQSRDKDGKWSAAEAQANGEAAMKKVLAEKQDVFAAMHRPELGDVDFRYGNDKGGIAHVVAEHG